MADTRTVGINEMSWLVGAGTFLQMWGLFESGRAARITSQRQKMAADFAAWQADELAKANIAIATRQANEISRQGRLEASRALAVAAASGGGVSDPTVVNQLAAIKGESAYRAGVALYEGEAKARQLRLEAAAGRLSGSYAVETGIATEGAYGLAAGGAGLRGAASIGSLYARYGRGGPGSGDEALITEPAYSWQG